VKKHAVASGERDLCKDSLQRKTEEREKLRGELEGQDSEADDSKEIESTKERLSACEAEIAELRERIEKLEGDMEEEDMQTRRGKNIIMVGTKMFMRMAEHGFKEKEEEYKRLLKEKEEDSDYKNEYKKKNRKLLRLKWKTNGRRVRAH
jgi:TolA-binding protein